MRWHHGWSTYETWTDYPWAVKTFCLLLIFRDMRLQKLLSCTGLKFSGIIEGVNRITVLKFRSIPITLKKLLKFGNSGKTKTLDVSYGLVRVKFNQNFPENLVLKAWMVDL